MCLDTAKEGKRFKIKSINADGKLFYKLLDMGFINGAELKVIREAPLHDPMELKIHNYLITIRRSEAALIAVEEL